MHKIELPMKEDWRPVSGRFRSLRLLNPVLPRESSDSNLCCGQRCSFCTLDTRFPSGLRADCCREPLERRLIFWNTCPSAALDGPGWGSSNPKPVKIKYIKSSQKCVVIIYLFPLSVDSLHVVLGDFLHRSGVLLLFLIRHSRETIQLN